MKYMKRKNKYVSGGSRNGTYNNEYFPSKLEAFSYGWWRYLQVINGILVFNNYSYSVSTNKHQRDLLQHIGYNAPQIFVRDRESLNGIASIIRFIKILENECKDLRDNVLKAGTRKKTNLDRLSQIEFKIENMKKIVDTFNLVDYNISIETAKQYYNEGLAKYGGNLRVAFEGK